MKPFLAELKRRKVVRVAIVYVVVGLVVVEAANNLLPALNLPSWTVTLVVALAILGFPVAVALAWAFDITPGGWCALQRRRSAKKKPLRQRSTLHRSRNDLMN